MTTPARCGCGAPTELHVLPGHTCPQFTEDQRVYARTEPDGHGHYGWIRWQPGRLVLLDADDTVVLDVAHERVRSLCGLVGQDRARVLDADDTVVLDVAHERVRSLCGLVGQDRARVLEARQEPERSAPAGECPAGAAQEALW